MKHFIGNNYLSAHLPDDMNKSAFFILIADFVVLKLCNICYNQKRNFNDCMSVEYPLSMSLEILESLVDYNQVRRLPYGQIVRRIKADDSQDGLRLRPIVTEATKLAIEREQFVQLDIFLGIFRANLSAWPWLSEKFGLSQLNGQTLGRSGIYLRSEEIRTVLAGGMVLPNKSTFDSFPKPDTKLDDIDIDTEDYTLTLKRRHKYPTKLKRKRFSNKL